MYVDVKFYIIIIHQSDYVVTFTLLLTQKYKAVIAEFLPLNKNVIYREINVLYTFGRQIMSNSIK